MGLLPQDKKNPKKLPQKPTDYLQIAVFANHTACIQPQKIRLRQTDGRRNRKYI
jgi:hypothetical protein